MRTPFLFLALPLGVAACAGQPAQPQVADAWIRLPAVPGRPAAAYWTLTGGAADQRLASVATPAAARVELHESMSGHAGMAGMRPLADIPLPAGATIAFAPGGRHAMLFDLAPDLAPGGVVPVKLTFADGTTIGTNARLVGAGDPAP